jgi:hypothetical protein
VNTDGTWAMIADLSAFQKAHLVANPDLDDFEPDGTWYRMVAVRGQLIAVEPNHQEIESIDPSTGAIRRLIDMSTLSSTWLGPTSIAYHGNFTSETSRHSLSWKVSTVSSNSLPAVKSRPRSPD